MDHAKGRAGRSTLGRAAALFLSLNNSDDQRWLIIAKQPVFLADSWLLLAVIR